MTVEFESNIDLLEKLKLFHITIPKEILLKTVQKDHSGSIYNQRFIITIDDKLSWHAGSVSLGNESAYITISKARLKKLDKHLGDKLIVKLEVDTSEFGFEVPEEWTACLEQDPEAKKIFLELRKGFQRNIIYYILQVKSSQKKIERSLFYLENLKRSPQGQTTMRHVLGKDLD